MNQVLADFSEARIDGLPVPAGFEPDLVPVRMILRRFANKLGEKDLSGLAGEEKDRELAGLFIEQVLQDLREDLHVPAAEELLKRVFNAGKVLLVLDGLDEIPSALRGVMQQAVQALLNVYPVARTVITCRVRSYQEKEKHILGFATYTLAPFTNDQMKAFVKGWYNTPYSREHFGEEKANEKCDDLTTAVLGPSLQDLARNPMLLTTMAVIHQRDIGLPDQRARLYDLAVDVLLRRWLSHRGSDIKASDDLKAFLADDRRLLPAMNMLAYTAHATGSGKTETTDLPRGDALTLLEKKAYLGSYTLAGEFLDYVDQRSGILVGQGGVDGEAPLSYSFPHRTFQEYLAGCYIVSRPNIVETLIEHAEQDDYWYVPVQMGLEELLHNRKQDWQLLRLAYQLCPPSFPEQDTEKQRLILWAGVMVQLVTKSFVLADEKSPGGGPGFYERLQRHLVGLLEGTLPPLERAEAGRVLGRLGDPRPELQTLDAMSFCYVPAGRFLMGDDAVEIDVPYAYWISQNPVTNAQFQAFVEDGGYEDKQWWTEAGWKEQKEVEKRIGPYPFGYPFNLPNHPVVGVMWHEAHAFTRWLTVHAREKNWIGPADHIQMPNEPEWEKAARGGIDIPKRNLVALLPHLSRYPDLELEKNANPGRRYPWGEEITPEHCNYRETRIGSTTTPGCFRKDVSPYGMNDMGGNVWEWNRAAWEESAYPKDEKKWPEREDPGSGSDRVIRGGSGGDDARYVRSAYRGWSHPGYRGYHLGFRIVRTYS